VVSLAGSSLSVQPRFSAETRLLLVLPELHLFHVFYTDLPGGMRPPSSVIK
jgi:hypothetical protein